MPVRFYVYVMASWLVLQDVFRLQFITLHGVRSGLIDGFSSLATGTEINDSNVAEKWSEWKEMWEHYSVKIFKFFEHSANQSIDSNLVTLKVPSGNFIRFKIDAGARCNVLPVHILHT